MERLKITVNFKHTPEEEKLYNELVNYSSPGGYIKDVLLGKIKRDFGIEVIVKERPKAKNKESKANNEDLEINTILDL